MSIRDKIRDGLYGSDQDSVEGEVALSAFSEVIEATGYTHSAIKVLAITVTGEVGLIVMCLIARDQVDGFLEDENFVYAAMATFVLGFLIAFTTFRLMEQSFGAGYTPHSNSGGILSGYTGRDHHSGYFWIWFLSAGAGVLNVILFYVLLRFL